MLRQYFNACLPVDPFSTTHSKAIVKMVSIFRFGLCLCVIVTCISTSACVPSWNHQRTRSQPNPLPKVKVNENGFFVDDRNRVLILHGLNSVVKEFPWYSKDLLNDTVLDYFQQWGFNVIRLGTMWSGVEPQKNAYNETYLDVLDTIVRKLSARGIYAFLDMHQDVMSRRFGTYDGFPSWLVDSLPKPSHPYPWPFPDDKFQPGNWALQYLTEGCSVAFQGFYENYNGSLSQFAKFWKKVATKFRSRSGVLGYELINEPWAGDVLHQPSLFLPGNAGRRNLLPAYELLHDAIRSVDQQTIVLFEPVTWGVIFNGKYAGSGFSHVPGGAAYRNRTALSYHMYCWVLTDADRHKPYPVLKRILCDDVWASTLFKTAVADIKSLGCGGLLTEFGNCQPDKSKNSTDTVECENVMKLADENLQSWTYWDVIFFSRGQIQWDIAKPFIRTYPRAIAGTPVSISYDPNTYIFMFSYSLDASIAAPTEIFVPKLHYPNGFSVKLSDGVAWTYDRQSSVVSVKLNAKIPSATTIYVRIAPNVQ
ncbi:endoglycoceramidase-like [Tubulanus polymorphus]|uniref:endoglycoceramidase-like n=1 Tax=Tubulanus polymorphus TaxID=672921 RepID=UPI003DA1CE7A